MNSYVQLLGKAAGIIACGTVLAHSAPLLAVASSLTLPEVAAAGLGTSTGLVGGVALGYDLWTEVETR